MLFRWHFMRCSHSDFAACITNVAGPIPRLHAYRRELLRMREPMLTPEQAAAARSAAMQERERLHAAAEERRELILQVRAGQQHQALLLSLHNDIYPCPLAALATLPILLADT